MGLRITFCSTHQWQEGHSHPDAPKEVDVHHVAEIFNCAPLDLSPVRDASIVHHCPQTCRQAETVVSEQLFDTHHFNI